MGILRLIHCVATPGRPQAFLDFRVMSTVTVASAAARFHSFDSAVHLIRGGRLFLKVAMIPRPFAVNESGATTFGAAQAIHSGFEHKMAPEHSEDALFVGLKEPDECRKGARDQAGVLVGY